LGPRTEPKQKALGCGLDYRSGARTTAGEVSWLSYGAVMKASWLLIVAVLGCGKKDSESVAAKPAAPTPPAAPPAAATAPAADDPNALAPPSEGTVTIAMVLANAPKAPSKWNGRLVTIRSANLGSLSTIVNGRSGVTEMKLYDIADTDQKAPLSCTVYGDNMNIETANGVKVGVSGQGNTVNVESAARTVKVGSGRKPDVTIYGIVKVEAGVVSLERCATK
jgi:hypothetical protein